MQSICQSLKRLSLCNKFITNNVTNFPEKLATAFAIPSLRTFGAYEPVAIEKKDPFEKRTWLTCNEKMYPPQALGEEKRPAFVCHVKKEIKYSPKKMWYIACFVRGMTIDEAVKQLTFLNKKGAGYVKDTILEAQKMAVEEHNVEFKSNLWIAESFVGKGKVIKSMRHHRGGRRGEIRYMHCHYFVRLEEGTPPKNYYQPAPKSGEELFNTWMDQMHKRRIPNSL